MTHIDRPQWLHNFQFRRSDNVPKAGVWPLHHYWKLLHKS